MLTLPQNFTKMHPELLTNMSSTQTDKTVLHLFASHTQGLIWRRGLPGFNPDWKIPDRGYKFLPKVQLGSSFVELVFYRRIPPWHQKFHKSNSVQYFHLKTKFAITTKTNMRCPEKVTEALDYLHKLKVVNKDYATYLQAQ